MTTLDFTIGDARWQGLRDRALADFYWFAGTVLNYGDLIPMREGPHKLLCKFIARQTGCPDIDNAPIRKIEMPRETGKTTLNTQAYPIWRLCKYPNMSLMIANEKAKTAEAFLGAIQKEFEQNEFLRALFPEIIPPDFNKAAWNATESVLVRETRRKEPSLFTIGAGGTVTGMHPDEIIVDDMISREAMENARRGSWQIMEEMNRWINQLPPLLSTNAEPMPSITFIGTRWWHGDCYEYIEKAFANGEVPRRYLLKTKLDDGTVQTVTVMRVGDLAIFRRAAIEQGRSIFPEKWDLDKLAQMRVRDPALFACNYMNNPSNEEMATFKTDWLRFFHWIEPDKQFRYTDHVGAVHQELVAALDVVAFVDPGGFSMGKGSDRARPAIVVVGQRAEKIFLLHAYSENETYQVAAETLVDLCRRYGVRKVYIEGAGQQVAFIDLCKRLVLSSGQTVSWDINKPGMKDKDDRILELEPFFQGGSVYVGAGPAFAEFMQQYQQFPRSARKDVLDCLSYGPRVWRKRQGAGRQSAAEVAAADLAAYRSRRGLQPNVRS